MILIINYDLHEIAIVVPNGICFLVILSQDKISIFQIQFVFLPLSFSISRFVYLKFNGVLVIVMYFHYGPLQMTNRLRPGKTHLLS